MKSLTIITLFAALLFVGCSETIVEQKSPLANETSLPDLTASFADKGETRTYVENGKYLRWHEADQITAFFGNTLNHQYKFNGATGANSGTFSLVPSDELGTGNSLDAIYAIYPYDANATITDEGVISLALPAVQNYAENSFGKDANTMVSVTESTEDTFLSFKNTCGYLKLKLYNADGATIKSVEVKGNADEKIAGAATASMTYGGTPSLTMADGATTTVTLDCGEDGVTLGTTAETATEFWIVLPETTFANGITIKATHINGNVFKKSTENEVTITRNDIQPMATLEFEATIINPENCKIYYTATRKIVEQSKHPWSETTFGANIVSNEWDETTSKGVITFDGEVTSIGDFAFGNNGSSLQSVVIPGSVTLIGESAFAVCKFTSVTVPEGVKSIGKEAFSGCTELASITLPNSLISIGWGAFAECWNLSSITIPDSVTSIGMVAFCNCKSLKEFYCKPTAPPLLGENNFLWIDDDDNVRYDCTIYVPTESVIRYKAAKVWSNYVDMIVGKDF